MKWIVRTFLPVLLSLFIYANSIGATDSLLRLENDQLFVDADNGVDITVTCGSWGPHSEGAARIYLHQGPYMDTHTGCYRTFGNWEYGKAVDYVYFPKDVELIFEVYTLLDKNRYFTGPASRNPDQQVHSIIEAVEGDSNSFNIRFEHSPYGGTDNFSDTQFTVTAREAIGGNAPEPETISMGINLDPHNYYSKAFVFVDAMKSAMPWVTQNNQTVSGGQNPWDSGVIDQIPCDENGYPLELPYDVPGTEAPQIVVSLLSRVDGNYPGGIYTVYYEGNGNLKFGFDAKVISQEPGKILLNVTPSVNGIIIKVKSSELGNHIRNIRVIMQGYEEIYEQQIFLPQYLARIQDFKVLRYMEMQKINSNLETNWEDRTTPTFYTQGLYNAGVALEHLIDLSNRTDTDPWFSVPHASNDNYIRQMARLIRDSLYEERNVYLEYSSEVWNNSFPQSDYAMQKGCVQNLGENCFDGINDSSDEFWSGIYYIAKRSAEIFNIFEDEFGEEKHRIIKVLAGFTSIPYAQEQLLEKFHDAGINPSGIAADALAITGYFGCSADDIASHGEVNTITVDEILTRTEHSMTQTLYYLSQNKSIADQYVLPIIAYEGGQHLVATGGNKNNSVLTSKLIEANRHPKMQMLHEKMFRAWFNYGGSHFSFYRLLSNYSKHGSWGALESLDQSVEEAYKYQALINF